MKVVFISRATLYSSPGGDTQQLLMTAENLRMMGVEVDVRLTNEVIDYKKYDLLHFFNIIRPADILQHIEASGKPYVVSTIFVEYGDMGKAQQSFPIRILKKITSPDFLEYIKVIARAIKNGEKIVSKSYLWRGHRKSIRYIAKHAKCLLPNSQSEYNRFKNTYGVAAPYHVVPNGIDEQYVHRNFSRNPEYKDAIISMGRIEARKNQLNLIRALNNTALRLFIHGKASPNAAAYFGQCKQEAAPNVTVGGWLSGDDLYRVYASAKVHVLPSYFETTGLSSLEAAVMGCNIVITDRGDTRDYFKDYAWYCDPDDPASIKQAVEAAHKAPYNEAFRNYILQNYTWKKAAEETLAAYKKVLG